MDRKKGENNTYRIMDNKDKIKELEKEILKLRKENQRLKKIEEEYEEHKHECSILDKKLPYFIKEEIKKRHKTSGQKIGHKGYSRKIPERINFIKKVILDKCPECQGKDISKVQEVRERFVEDIPEPTETIITKYEIERKYCRNCKKIVEKDVEDALPNSRYGLRVMLLVSFMKIGLALPSQKIIQMLQAQYGLIISDGEIYKMLEQVAQAFGLHYKKLQQKIREAAVKHSDETGWRINGKSHWLWLFINSEAAIYIINKKRSSNVPVNFFRDQKNKTIINERYMAYNVLAKKKQVNDLFHKIDLIAEKRYKHSEVRKFVKSVCKFHRENLFRFVTNLEIEATNNRAERGIRKAVIIRKISNGNRSKKGVDIFGVLLSVIETLKLQGKNPLKEMQRIIQASGT